MVGQFLYLSHNLRRRQSLVATSAFRPEAPATPTTYNIFTLRSRISDSKVSPRRATLVQRNVTRNPLTIEAFARQVFPSDYRSRLPGLRCPFETASTFRRCGVQHPIETLTSIIDNKLLIDRPTSYTWKPQTLLTVHVAYTTLLREF